MTAIILSHPVYPYEQDAQDRTSIFALFAYSRDSRFLIYQAEQLRKILVLIRFIRAIRGQGLFVQVQLICALGALAALRYLNCCRFYIWLSSYKNKIFAQVVTSLL